MHKFSLIVRRINDGTRLAETGFSKFTETWLLLGLIPIYTRDFLLA